VLKFFCPSWSTLAVLVMTEGSKEDSSRPTPNGTDTPQPATTQLVSNPADSGQQQQETAERLHEPSQQPSTGSESSDSSSAKDVDPFVQLQAILAGLPMYALREDHGCSGCCCASRRGGCLCCCHPRVIEHMPWVLPCQERIAVALLAARSDFPRFRAQLGRLKIAHASHDLTIFVDDEERRMFTSLRGTDCRTCRDLCNDVLIFCGCWLCRTKWAKEEYCHTRREFPGYQSFGCGHSLGGTVMTEMAHLVEDDAALAFERVDVFNTGGSPLGWSYCGFKATQYYSHRIVGDIISRYFSSPGNAHEYSGRPEFCSHSLQHFLPERTQTFGEMLHNAEVWAMEACSTIGGRVRSGADILAQGVSDGAEAVVTRVQSGAEVLKEHIWFVAEEEETEEDRESFAQASSSRAP